MRPSFIMRTAAFTASLGPPSYVPNGRSPISSGLGGPSRCPASSRAVCNFLRRAGQDGLRLLAVQARDASTFVSQLTKSDDGSLPAAHALHKICSAGHDHDLHSV